MDDNSKKEAAKGAAKAAHDKNAELAKQIKAMENQKRADAAPQVTPPPMGQRMHFDAWYALRGASIPNHHMKEILRADFGARGLTDMETLQRFDAALAQYGVKAK